MLALTPFVGFTASDSSITRRKWWTIYGFVFGIFILWVVLLTLLPHLFA